MPLPTPDKGETQDNWMERCMGNPKMNTEFPESDQRAGVCHTQWEQHQKARAALEKLKVDGSAGTGK